MSARRFLSGAMCKMGSLVRAMWIRAVGDAGTFGRVERGQKIAGKKGHVKRRAHNRYDVQSQSDESTTYEVRFTAVGPSCECPDHQYRKTACKHIIAVIQRNSDSARDKAGASAPDAKCAPNPGARRGGAVQADEPTASDPATGIDADVGKPGKKAKQAKAAKRAKAGKAAKPGKPGKKGKAAKRAKAGKAAKPGKPGKKGKAAKRAKDTGGAAGSRIFEIAKEEAVARLTASFPGMDVLGMSNMPPKDALVAMHDAFGRLAPHEVTAEVREHAQALIIALADEVASEDPEVVIRLVPADGDPPACPECGAEYSMNGPRYNKKGKEQTYICKGPEPHRFIFNPGFERMRYPNETIARAVRLYPKFRSLRVVADELLEGGKGPHVSTVCRWVNAMVGRMVKFLKAVGMKSIGRVCSTDEIIEKVPGKGSCISTALDHASRFWLSAVVSRSKSGQNAAGQFREAREMTGRDPLATRSDSLSAIARGFREVYGDVVCSILLSCAHIRNQWCTNNRHERFNATLRELLFGRRGRLTEAVITAAWLYYNYFRPHMALGETTPAEKAGMTICGPDKITTLIQNAAMAEMAWPRPRWTKNERAARAAAA